MRDPDPTAQRRMRFEHISPRRPSNLVGAVSNCGLLVTRFERPSSIEVAPVDSTLLR